MEINNNSYREVYAREKSLEYLKKAEDIFKINLADYCGNIIFIYLNYCWIYSQEILLKNDFIPEDRNKIEYFLQMLNIYKVSGRV